MKALVFSGGGARIHYLAGAASCLVPQQQYDLYAGVSAGAIVAAYLAQYDEDSSITGAYGLLDVLEGLQEHHVHKRWPLGYLTGLWKTSFRDSRPLQYLIWDHIKRDAIRASGKKLRVGAVTLDGGLFQLFDERHDRIVEAVVASSAIPGMFEPAEIGGRLWVDGGIRVFTPIHAAIAAGASEIDVVLSSFDRVPQRDFSKANAVDVAQRAIEVMIDEIMDKDIELAQAYTRLAIAGAAEEKVPVRLRVVRPRQRLPLSDMDFDSPLTKEVSVIGARDAERMLAHG